MKFPRVLAESEDFFAGLHHLDSPVQIRSAPLEKAREIDDSRVLLFPEILKCQETVCSSLPVSQYASYPEKIQTTIPLFISVG